MIKKTREKGYVWAIKIQNNVPKSKKDRQVIRFANPICCFQSTLNPFKWVENNNAYRGRAGRERELKKLGWPIFGSLIPPPEILNPPGLVVSENQ